MLHSTRAARGLIKSTPKANIITKCHQRFASKRQLRPLSERPVTEVPQPPKRPGHNANSKGKTKARAKDSTSLSDPIELASTWTQATQPEALEPAAQVINQVGVQLLPPKLHAQIFPGFSLPADSDSRIEISQKHLKDHGLDINLASRLAEISFDLPTLQGANIDEHFYRIGAHMAEPWLSIANKFAELQGNLPPKPKSFNISSPGWTKYSKDDACLVDDLGSEEAICFDVETLPAYSPFPIMACAVSATCWYTWISPWLLGVSESPEHLIPIGDSSLPRVIVGHNVSYDRARILEEYSLQGTQSRFVDTMALHVAVKGISSGQRPAWASHRKLKRDQYRQRKEGLQKVQELIQGCENSGNPLDKSRYENLLRFKREIEESLREPMADAPKHSSDEADLVPRWEEITSPNSLAELAQLYCGVELEKETRKDFMVSTREEILENLGQYLVYCGNDVSTTLEVYAKVLPAFLESCSSPVTAAGIFTMGSSFLTLDQEWDAYIESAESKYRELESAVRSHLHKLAQDALDKFQNDIDDRRPWEADNWLSQLDWTPKRVGKSRGETSSPSFTTKTQPKWYSDVQKDKMGTTAANRIVPFLLGMTWSDEYGEYCLGYSSEHGWVKGKPVNEPQHQPPVVIADDDELAPFRDELRFVPLSKSRVRAILSANRGGKWIEEGMIMCPYDDLALRFCTRKTTDSDWEAIRTIANEVLSAGQPTNNKNITISQLDWRPVRVGKVYRDKSQDVHWPKWYWELTAPRPGAEPGTLDLTTRSQVAPLLMRLSWLGNPLFRSRQHGWTYRVPKDKIGDLGATSLALVFQHEDDSKLQAMSESGDFFFYKLPHKDGEKANVGSPMSKTFVKYFKDGTLTGPGDDVKSALDMNAQCSYWISARDRVRNQVVLWDGDAGTSMGMPSSPPNLYTPSLSPKYGMVLPQVITMGTVTRRAIEKTWLTASNAKPNRVGSELKALVRAPEGYSLVGADVDSEELWIASVMGDAQFGIHGATAIGWMTLEGTKAAGTDLHSKTASILGISRNQAKVFNYSRIYGAGINHAVLLLLQHNASMKEDEANALAQKLYASTKGKSTPLNNPFEKKFWYGGSESYLFNKLESIALSDDPRTPALNCGVTSALLKKHLPKKTGQDYMTSRINWVVQSSGVDYLHMLIVAVDYLIQVYKIKARYLISIHDEVRYLAEEEDKYRLALALQIANLWTRCMFAYRLGFDNLPQGVAFFSAVDVDKFLRKEVDMDCITPSHPNPLPPGESLTIDQILEKTGKSLSENSSVLNSSVKIKLRPPKTPYNAPNVLTHREKSIHFLKAQMATDKRQILSLGLKHRASILENQAELEDHAQATGSGEPDPIEMTWG